MEEEAVGRTPSSRRWRSSMRMSLSVSRCSSFRTFACSICTRTSRAPRQSTGRLHRHPDTYCTVHYSHSYSSLLYSIIISLSHLPIYNTVLYIFIFMLYKERERREERLGSRSAEAGSNRIQMYCIVCASASAFVCVCVCDSDCVCVWVVLSEISF